MSDGLIHMPKLGLTMTEGVLAEWRVGPGDAFRQGDILMVIETDKIATEVEAEQDGRIAELLHQPGATIAVGAPLARLGGNGAAPAPVTPAEPPPPTDRIVATPLARRIARENDVDLKQVKGSGPRGRIKAEDVRLAGTPRSAKPETPVAAGQWQAATGFEKAVARRLTQSKRDTPHFYLSTEIDAGPLLTLREQLAGKRPTITHLIVAALARTLVAMSEANRVWQDDGFVLLPTVDIGIAVDTDGGLMAPVLHDIGGATLSGIAARAGELIASARSGNLAPDDLRGGAVTVSNAGMHDVTQMIPIITPGQSMIVGVGSVRDVFRPDTAGQPVLRQEINLTMSFDHRVFDGVGGLNILNRLREYLESPLTILA